MKIALGTQNQVYFHTRQNTMSFLRATLLQDDVPGFKAGRSTLLKVRYLESGRVVYHRYEGGPVWMGTVPNNIGRPGQRLTLSAELLTKHQFIRNIPCIKLRNEVGFSWLPDESQIVRILDGRALCVVVQQQPAVEGISKFDVRLEPSEHLGFGPGKGCFLEAGLKDFFGHTRKMRIYHDGHSNPWLGIRQGRKFPRVSFLSSDGVRLRLAYGSTQVRVASFYLRDPKQLYSSVRVEQLRGLDIRRLPWKPSGSYHVSPKRELESKMLQSRYRYPHGRLGTEIAYSIAARELDFERLTLNDPSAGGADMMTGDGKVIFENRLVTITEAMSREALERQIVFELGRLKSRLRSDFAFYQTAEIGYAFLSFVGADGLETLMFELT